MLRQKMRKSSTIVLSKPTDKKSVRFEGGSNISVSSLNQKNVGVGTRNFHRDTSPLITKTLESPQMSDLSDGDKMKISRLVEKVIELGISCSIYFLFFVVVFILFFCRSPKRNSW